MRKKQLFLKQKQIHFFVNKYEKLKYYLRKLLFFAINEQLLILDFNNITY